MTKGEDHTQVRSPPPFMGTLFAPEITAYNGVDHNSTHDIYFKMQPKCIFFSTNNAFKALSSCLACERHVTKFKHPSAKLESVLARCIRKSQAHTVDIASGAIAVRLASPASNAQKLTEHLTAPSFKFCL